MTYFYRKVLGGITLVGTFFCTSAVSAAALSPGIDQSTKSEPIDLNRGMTVISQKKEQMGECCAGRPCTQMP